MKEDIDRYLRAAHAMQSGVATEMNLPEFDNDVKPKHLRVGINSAMVNDEGLARLLVEKGIFTQDEYEKAIADAMEAEVRRHEALLNKRYGGTKIKLS